MKSIKSKILVAIVLLVSISLVLVGGTSIFLNYSGTVALLEKTMTESAILASDRVSKELKSYENISIEAGGTALMADPNVSVAEKKAMVDQSAAVHGLKRGNVLSESGRSIFDGKEYSDREYFQTSMNGETSISEPLVSKMTGELSIIISSPIWDKGVQGSNVIGVVYFVPPETFLNDIMSTIKISENSKAYMIDKEGNTIADINIDTIKEGQNIEELAKSDVSLAELAVFHTKMEAGETGFGSYKEGRAGQFIAYAPIANTDGWSIGITAPINDFMSASIQSTVSTLILLLVSIIVAVLIAITVSRKISNPIIACTGRLTQLAQGDLMTPVPDIISNDETGLLVDSTRTIVFGLRELIVDLGRNLNAIAMGDLTTTTTTEFPGDFAQLQASLGKLNKDLNMTLSQINQAAEQVSAGSDQMASAAQDLSQGTMEQASSIEELSATITEISQKVKVNAGVAEEANTITKETGIEVRNGNNHMKEMVEAMTEISDASGEIGKIIKTIEDIAFQTNILALNAAVEAARAGEAGKGFAVVADEVRNLAQKSAEAAQNTTALIERAVSAVEKGTGIANVTEHSLVTIVEKVESVISHTQNMTSASLEQAESIGQVTEGVDQISNVVQTNSATAEESAATSQELNAQAQMMKSLVGKFKLKE